jgi:hypothetical protein
METLTRNLMVGRDSLTVYGNPYLISVEVALGITGSLSNKKPPGRCGTKAQEAPKCDCLGDGCIIPVPAFPPQSHCQIGR